jgi:hypothetical protein
MFVFREKSSQNADSFRILRVEKNRRFVSKGEAAQKEAK